ncbi:polysaccharide lyase domain-containing protein [Roseateles oligotrophus]|uniref:Right handed beta helix domain-containing protein n=1 Tax=Roseateles oligotrophus TaxID=1769250 RepID=A0ABT2YBZ0_9BURK|nr:hypothetical protein [Roseateles oligotrophus]MCV2367145.1 hypothetical protein [Roseateles oligotrophus]
MKLSPRKLLLWLVAAVIAVGLLIGYLLLRQFEFEKLRDEYKERTPGELIRYARIRLLGHEYLESIMLPVLAAVEASIERPIPDTKLPSLSKGQQSFSFAPIHFSAKGQAQAESAMPNPDAPLGNASDLRVSSSAELLRAMQNVRAGQTILIAPGRYAINRAMVTKAAGEPEFPITVRASKPGTVRLETRSAVGFRVAHPFWVFENLHLRGLCEEQGNCEHAFHIVGGARGTVLRNNLIEEFNAHIRVNGEDEAWPDDGLIQFNTFTNSRARATQRLVAPIDIVGANRWQVTDNHISNISKSEGNKIAYGMLLRGGGHGGRLERNLIVCTTQSGSNPGIRVGLSFGGSSTDKSFCREQCTAEHQAGVASSNVIAHCNDFGIDINQSTSILAAHNSLINTAGIDVRGPQSSATVYGNLLDGRIRQRDGSRTNVSMNEVLELREYLHNPDGLDLRWRNGVESIPALPLIADDFCGQARGSSSLPGAIRSQQADCFKAAPGRESP